MARAMSHQDNQLVSAVRRRVRQALADADLSGHTIGVAVSGGPDSMALFDALMSLREELNLTLHGAHLDHGLRGQASSDDGRFVRELFVGAGIDATVEEADVAVYQRTNRLSLEEAARDVRYAFLAKVANQQGAAAVAVGHTSDDQAESILMHLVRGTGLTGLRGMQTLTQRVSGNANLKIVRPILEVSRADTVAYCSAMDLEPRHDVTNEITDMTRNRIRAELLPMLESYNPSVKQALIRLSKNASVDLDFISRQVDAVWDLVCKTDAGSLRINLEAYRELHPSLQQHLFRRAILHLKGDLADVEQKHLEAMAVLAQGSAGKGLDLPGGIRFQVGYDEATVTSSATISRSTGAPKECRRLSVPGDTELTDWHVHISIVAEANTVQGSEFIAYLSQAALGEEVWVRSRRPGDRFQPLGMSHQKKLQDFMVDSKISREQRDYVPLLVTPRGIAWVVGWRVSDWAKVKDTDTKSIEVRFTKRV